MAIHFPDSVYRVHDRLESILTNDKFAFSLTNGKQIRNMIEESANKHSTDIEYPELEYTGKAKKIMRKAKQEALGNNVKAWKFTKHYVESGKDLNPTFISLLLRQISPEQQLSPYTGFRDSEVLVGTHAPPRHEEVLPEINEMIFELKNFQIPLEKAIFSHYHLLRIHPGADGNGRCSRMVQNAYLYSNNNLPLIIREDEKQIYFELLRETDKRFYAQQKKYLKSFSEFLAKKMNQSIDVYKYNIRNDQFVAQMYKHFVNKNTN